MPSATVFTTYYTVSPSTGDATSPDTLCNKTWVIIIAYDGTNYYLIQAMYALGIDNLWASEIEAATLKTFNTLPMIIQNWLSLYNYGPTFDTYA